MPNFPNRCQHIKVNGTLCGSPALRRNRFCYFHKLHQDQRIELNTDCARRKRNVTIALPVLEDANSIQVSLMQIMRLIVAGQIDGKTAGLLLYALQTASSNLPRTNFQPYMYEVVLDPKKVHETPLNAQIWQDEDFRTDKEADEDQDETTPAEFTPLTPNKARNQAELDRWAEAEADRLAIIGARERKAERQAEIREEQLEAERVEEEEEEEEAAEQQEKSAVSKNTSPTATVTPAGRAIVPTKTTPPPNKRPPANVSMDEVRKKVSAQIRRALPAIAAAVRANGNQSG
jgi:hypothetical protein